MVDVYSRYDSKFVWGVYGGRRNFIPVGCFGDNTMRRKKITMSDIQKTADCLSNVVMNMDKKGEAKPKKTKVCVWAGYITEDEANEAVYYCKDCMGWVKIKNGLCKHLRGSGKIREGKK